MAAEAWCKMGGRGVDPDNHSEIPNFRDATMRGGYAEGGGGCDRTKSCVDTPVRMEWLGGRQVSNASLHEQAHRLWKAGESMRMSDGVKCPYGKSTFGLEG